MRAGVGAGAGELGGALAGTGVGRPANSLSPGNSQVSGSKAKAKGSQCVCVLVFHLNEHFYQVCSAAEQTDPGFQFHHLCG